MDSKEIYKNYLKALGERLELEEKIEKFIERWKNGEINVSTSVIQDATEKNYQRLEDLKKIEKALQESYEKREQMEHDKKSADIGIRQNLGEAPSNIEITGGVLGTDASQSHLIGQTKSVEQLQIEKEQMLNNVKAKVQRGELTLAEASNLVNSINTSYNLYLSEEESNQIKR